MGIVITDDTEVCEMADHIRELLRNGGAFPIDDRQAEIIARFALQLREEIEELESRIEHMEQHPPGCRCRDCAIP